MKPRRPAVKDSVKKINSPGAKRKSEQVAARAARKAEAKEHPREDVNQAAARIIREATERG